MRPVVFAIAIAAGVLLSLSVTSSAASAQDWPMRPIKILTPLAAGGAADVLGRAVGEALALDIKQSVVVENRPGGGGALATLSTATPHIDGGRIRVLGMIEAARSRSRPDIPTIGETVRGYAVPSSWLGFLAPPKLSDALTQKMNAALVKAVNTPNVRKTLTDNGFDVATSTPAEFASILKQGLERYRKIIADAGMSAQ
jgi:tripartite-type tricarboxylate transporter receptor subunit TctC